jgi:glycosyltransferase involved in cell wall biosynthesis
MDDDYTGTLVVVPAFNEELSIGDVVKEILVHLPGATCLVVNDGSRDQTTSVARVAGATVAELPFNLGVGGAMRVGFNYALQNSFSAVIQIDGDGQHDPQFAPAVLARLQDHDLVIGARFAGVGQYESQGPRKWAMIFLAKTLSRSAGVPLTDTTSGFRATGPRGIELFAKHYPAEYLGDTVESLVLASRAGFLITQVPVAMRPRTQGTPSHGPIKSSLFLARVGLAVIFAYMRPKIVEKS